MWPFKKKPPKPIDKREWNEDWKVGDIAECVIGLDGYPDWEHTKPWDRLAVGSRWAVIGFSEGCDGDGDLRYFLILEGLSKEYSTNCFRKVRTVSREESEVIKLVLSNKNTVEGPKRLIEEKNDE